MGTEPVKRWFVGLLTLVMLCPVAACNSQESGDISMPETYFSKAITEIESADRADGQQVSEHHKILIAYFTWAENVENTSEVMNLYRLCETEGVGFSVMKPFSGVQLLKAETSPFGKALTEYQCIQQVIYWQKAIIKILLLKPTPVSSGGIAISGVPSMRIRLQGCRKFQPILILEGRKNNDRKGFQTNFPVGREE